MEVDEMEEIIQVIRKTGMSKVLLVKDRPKHYVVWKEVFNSEVMRTEIKALRLLKSNKDVVQFRRVKSIGGSKFIEMEYIHGRDLEHILYSQKYFEEEAARMIFQRIVITVLKIHRKNIFHRDLKLSNIMISQIENCNDFQLKIIDFGVACFGSDDTFFTKRIGTQECAAPEMILDSPYQASKSDVFSLGLILFQLLFGKLPFNIQDRISAISTEQKQPAIKFEEERPISAELRELITDMLSFKQSDRLSMDEVVLHPWLRIEGAELLVQKKKGFFGSLFKSSKGSATP